MIIHQGLFSCEIKTVHTYLHTQKAGKERCYRIFSNPHWSVTGFHFAQGSVNFELCRREIIDVIRIDVDNTVGSMPQARYMQYHIITFQILSLLDWRENWLWWLKAKCLVRFFSVMKIFRPFFYSDHGGMYRVSVALYKLDCQNLVSPMVYVIKKKPLEKTDNKAGLSNSQKDLWKYCL